MPAPAMTRRSCCKPAAACGSWKPGGGPPLGAVEHFRFPVDRDRCERGAMLLLYTDGVTEAQNRGGALYSADRLAALLAALPATDARAAVDAAFDDVRQFAGEAEPVDDITLLAIRRCQA